MGAQRLRCARRHILRVQMQRWASHLATGRGHRSVRCRIDNVRPITHGRGHGHSVPDVRRSTGTLLEL